MNLKEIHNIYFVGIGGIGMSALARYFHKNSVNVAGYDRVKSPITKALQSIGINICFEDSIDSIDKKFLDNKNTIVVYTPAVPNDHKQLNYFRDNNFKIFINICFRLKLGNKISAPKDKYKD